MTTCYDNMKENWIRSHKVNKKWPEFNVTFFLTQYTFFDLFGPIHILQHSSLQSAFEIVISRLYATENVENDKYFKLYFKQMLNMLYKVIIKSTWNFTQLHKLHKLITQNVMVIRTIYGKCYLKCSSFISIMHLVEQFLVEKVYKLV